jgi:hypothetical protein
MVELLTITAKAFFWFLDIGGIGDHHRSFSSVGRQFYQYQQTKRMF